MRDPISLSHLVECTISCPWPKDLVSLHYAGDTLLLVPRDARSPISLKLILYAFERIAGLNINFHNSYVYDFSKCDEVGTRAATILNCTSTPCRVSTLNYLSK